MLYRANKGEHGVNDWRHGAILYQIYPKSFFDTTGNGIGDLRGIGQKLDYIASLGVDGIWISPFFASPMVDNGYDVSDYRQVDPLFGTLQDFDDLVQEAHSRDLKIVIDQVYSHTSDQHHWFEESRAAKNARRADWYVWENAKSDGSPPNNWQSWFANSAWHWEPIRKQYYLANFHPQMPDLNLHNLEVQDAILSVAKFWLDRGVDGFRLDACNFYTHDRSLRSNPAKLDPLANTPVDMQQHIYNVCQPETLTILERLRHLCDQYDERFLIGEISSENDIVRTSEYTQPGRLHSAYSFEFLREAPTPQKVADALKTLLSGNSGLMPTLAFSNHDTPRVASRWSDGTSSRDQTNMINMLLLFLRGNACLYQGQELGLPQAEILFEELQDPAAITGWPHYKGRDGCRTPMPWEANSAHVGFSQHKPWLPIGQNHANLAVDKQDWDPEALLNQTRHAIAFRNESPALRSGDISFLYCDEDTLVFERKNEAENWLCAFNLSDRTKKLEALEQFVLEPGHSLRQNADQNALGPFGFVICPTKTA